MLMDIMLDKEIKELRAANRRLIDERLKYDHTKPNELAIIKNLNRQIDNNISLMRKRINVIENKKSLAAIPGSAIFLDKTRCF